MVALARLYDLLVGNHPDLGLLLLSHEYLAPSTMNLSPDMKRLLAEREAQDFARRCVAAGLSMPAREFEFHPTRGWRFDYAWPARRIALEIEGGVFVMKKTGRRGAHGSVKGVLKDIEKYNAAALHGWRVLRVLPKKLFEASTFCMLLRIMPAVPGERP